MSTGNEQSKTSRAPGGLWTRTEALLLVAVLAILLVLYWRAGHELYINWTLVDSYYSHGFLVPFVTLAFLWRDRRALRRIPAGCSGWGFLWMAGAACLLVVGDFFGFRVFGHVSLIPMLIGLLLLFQGLGRTRAMWFPLAFLFFMIPIPPSLTQSIALRLKLFAAECAVGLANAVTLPMVRQGSSVYFGDDYLVIGDICGGLRSLIALLALGALMAYVSKTRPWARIVVLLFAGPIAVVANVFRIFLLCVVGHFYGSKIAAGRVHDISGYLIFVVALVLFLALEALLRRVAPSPASALKDAAGSATDAAAWWAPIRVPHVVSAGLLVCLTAVHLLVLHGQAAASQAPPAVALQEIPAQIVEYQQVGRNKDVSDRAQEVLENSPILIRTYVAPTGRPVSLTIVYAGTTRRSLHFPEVCLVGEGWEVHRQEMAPVGVMFNGKRLVLGKQEQREAVLYWFKTGDTFTGNYFLNAFYWARNQVSSGAPTSSMVRVSTPIAADGEAGAFAVLEDFAVKLVPVLRQVLD